MKKLVLFMAVATAVAFAACGNAEEATEETPADEANVEEATPVQEDEIVEDVVEEAVPAEEATPAE